MPQSANSGWSPRQFLASFCVFFALLIAICAYAWIHPAPKPQMFTNAKAVLVASDSVHAQITAANLNFDHQHYAQAADYYRQSLASDPQNPALRTDLALSLSQFGNIDEALHEAQTVLAPNPDFVPALNLAATLNFRQGNNDAAIALWTHLLAVNPHFSGKNRVDALISLATQRKIAPK